MTATNILCLLYVKLGGLEICTVPKVFIGAAGGLEALGQDLGQVPHMWLGMMICALDTCVFFWPYFSQISG